MMTPEGKVKAKVVAILKKHKVYYFFPATHGYGRSGVPDIIGCVNGKFLAIECKSKRGELTKLQEHNIEQIRVAKGEAFVIYGDEEELDILDQEIFLLAEGVTG